MLLALLAAGCGGGGGSGDGGHHASTTGSNSKPKPKPKPPPPPPHAIAAAQLENAGPSGDPFPLDVSIYDLRRQGPFLVLDFGVRCADPNIGCSLSQTLSPPGLPGMPLSGGDQDFLTAAGVYLVDPTGLAAYHAVRDGQAQAYASRLTTLDNASTTYVEWVRYPAPPPSVTAMDVAFPLGGTIVSNVPISTGSGPVDDGAPGYRFDPPDTFSQPPDSVNTSGLTLPVLPLTAAGGNTTGSDTETGRRETITLRSDVLFRFDKSSLTPRASAVLAHVAPQIAARALGTVQVDGYTDSIGPASVNDPLSVARADSVVTALQELTKHLHYSAAGFGDADPVAPNTLPGGADNPAGRALNRRVTISFAVTKRVAPAPLPNAAPAARVATAAGDTVTFTGYSKHQYQVTLRSLTQEAGVLVARLSIDCVSQGGGCSVENDLIGTLTVPPVMPYATADQNAYYSVDGFYLDDHATGEILAPLHDSYLNPVTSFLTSGKQSTPFVEWELFPAPPAGVQSMSLVTPSDNAETAPMPIQQATP